MTTPTSPPPWAVEAWQAAQLAYSHTPDFMSGRQAAATELARLCVSREDVLPVDDSSKAFSNSDLPDYMIEAGGDALDQAYLDLQNYKSDETIDWDSGMIVVAVYRAMTAAFFARQALEASNAK